MRSRIHRITARLRRGLADMSYAQTRVFENQTGIAVNDRGRRLPPAGPAGWRPSIPGIPS